MRTMETELQRLDNELYRLYCRSIEIAELKWLPYIKPKKDSHNSYPHVKGVMHHIDRLLYDDENKTFLNGSELYILLCAILMHDIGKGASKKSMDRDRITDHAFDSFSIIVSHWADLGLPTQKVAEIVADICRFHDCPDKAEMEELYTKYYIDQFNRADPIRGRILGALLFLGDHMDTTVSRTVPPFFKTGEPLEIVGKFRSKIADVRLDKQYKMIREILDISCFSACDIYVKGKELNGDLFQYFSNVYPAQRHLRRAKSSVLYTIAKDVLKNELEITLIKDELNVMGMPVKKWLIECDEQLFQIYKRKDAEGKTILDSSYALEPIINLDYCLEVLKGICMLSGGIFARQFFQYCELVNFIREEDKNTYKVKCAVRRLSLLLKIDEACGYVIYYDENNWSFYKNKKNLSSAESYKEANIARNHKDTVYNELKKIIVERLEKHNG